ncbi:protein lifeguard 1-like [Coccinella septempunctata]|uniref:protein lifeguard 1-like n=1 Tax=Coccinella septempunctata TaxID=41139 RepID=UPI001D097FE9|nr:protein lifeguard 1-like [Coccinella septempunctata]
MSYGGGAYPQGPYSQQQPYPGQQGYPAYPQQGYPGGYPPGPPPGQPGFNVPPQQPPYVAQDMYGGTDAGYKEPGMAAFEFSDSSIRRGFIKKVYSILMCQLAVSLAFIAWFVYDKKTSLYVQHNSWLVILAFVTIIITIIALSCCGDLRRKSPHNFIFLGLFTLAESFILAVCSSRYKTDIVFMAVGITAAVCLGLTLFAFQTKWDFTMIGGFLFVALIILMIFGFVTIFFRGKTMQMVYASFGALLFSVYLIYDTQLMLGGKHKYSVSPEEYVFAAMNLYLDIINIFIYILTILGNAKD